MAGHFAPMCWPPARRVGGTLGVVLCILRGEYFSDAKQVHGLYDFN